jgi:hypothetical protein
MTQAVIRGGKEPQDVGFRECRAASSGALPAAREESQIFGRDDAYLRQSTPSVSGGLQHSVIGRISDASASTPIALADRRFGEGLWQDISHAGIGDRGQG